MELRTQTEPLFVHGQGVLEVFDQVGYGAVLLDPLGRVLRHNRRAEGFLNSALRIRNQHLVATHAGTNAALQRLISEALASGSNGNATGRSMIVISRDEGRPFIVRLAPVTGLADASLHGARIVLLMMDPEECPQPPEDVLTQGFGLTPAEARLARRLTCGESLEEIAEAQRISMSTARTQLAAVFAKTQTRRQAELTSLLTRLARM